MKVKKPNKLFFEEENKDKKDIILFLHPKLLANWIWEEQKGNFDEYHCIYLDLPYHGNSQVNSQMNSQMDSYYEKTFTIKNSTKYPNEKTFTIKNSAKKIEKFLETQIKNKKEVTSINIIGFGLGGQIAIEIIKNKRNLINKAIISGIELRKIDKCYDINDSIIQILDKSKKEYLDDKKDSFLAIAYLRHYDMKKSFYKKMKKTLANFSQEKIKEISYETMNYDLKFDENNFNKLDKPNKSNDSNSRTDNEKNETKILLTYGNKEDLTIQKSVLELNSFLNNSKLIEVEKGVHLWNMKNSNIFNEIANDFFKSNNLKNYDKIKIFK